MNAGWMIYRSVFKTVPPSSGENKPSSIGGLGDKD